MPAMPHTIPTLAWGAVTALVVIEPRRGWAGLRLAELWRYRELIYILAWRDVKIRYRQTALGVAWAVIQPVLATVIFSVVFGRLMGPSTGDVPYPLFAYAGFLAWTYFANAVSVAGVSLVRNSSLVSKVYFPRLVIPIAALLPGLLDLLIGAVLLLGLAWALGLRPNVLLLLAPAGILLLVLAATAVSVWLAALDVQYRDVRYALPFVLQVWLFATPVIYPVDLVPEALRSLFALNPVTGAIAVFRMGLLGDTTGDALPIVAASVLLSVGIGVAGLAYFRNAERTFADTI